MLKKISAVLIAAFLLVCVFYTVKDLKASPSGGFSDTEMIFEGQGERRYYYNTLTKNAKIAYTRIVPEIYKHTQRIEVPRLSDEEFNSLMYAISYDNPDLLCYGKECEIIPDHGKYYFIPSYNHTLAEHEHYEQQLKNAVTLALAGITPDMDDYHKELYIHDYICRVCRYVLNDEQNFKASAYDVLVNGEAICEGYARTAQLLLNEAGIANYLVIGDALNSEGTLVGHMWNVVKIDGENYYLDITWDDMDSKEVNMDRCYLYFNVDESMISRDHHNISPVNNYCNSVKYNYFAVKDALYTGYGTQTRKSIEQGILKNVRAGEYSYEMMFTDDLGYESMSSELFDDSRVLEIIKYLNSAQSGVRFKKVEYITFDNANYVRLIFS